MANKFLSDLDGPYQTQAPDDWSWLDYIKAAGSDTGNALSNLAGGIIGGMSPFHPNAARAGQPSYQVPPMLLDAWEAINAPGKILNEGMTVEDRDRTATNAAGFMMGGGLVAPKPSAVRPNARLSSLPAEELASLETGWPIAATYGKRDQFGQIREFESYLPPTDIMMRDMRNAGDIDFDYMMRRADNESAPLRGASDIDYLNALGRQINDRDGELFSNGSKPGAAIGAGVVEGGSKRMPVVLSGGPGEFVANEASRFGLLANQAVDHVANLANIPAHYLDGRAMGASIPSAASDTFNTLRSSKNALNAEYAQQRSALEQGGKTPFSYTMESPEGDFLGSANGSVVGDTMYLDWLGGNTPNSLGVSGVKSLRNQVRSDFPEVKKFQGMRVSGARDRANATDRMQEVTLLSNGSKGGAGVGNSLIESQPQYTTEDLLRLLGIQ